MFWVPIQVVKLLPMAIKLQGVKNSEPSDGQALALKTLYAFKQQMTKGGSMDAQKNMSWRRGRLNE